MQKNGMLSFKITSVALFVSGIICAQTIVIDSSKIYELEQVEVLATRVDYKTPAVYTNLKEHELLQNSYGKDVPYLLQTTPSIVSMSDAGNGVGYTEIRMRGYDGTRINVTANGVPMNDAESHKMYWVDTPDFISAVGSIQVQRGAGTSTNGTGAFGGGINMTTDKLPSVFGGEASLSYGSFNTNKQSIRLSSGLLNKKWAVDGRLSHVYSDGYMERASASLLSYMVQAAYYTDKTMLKLLSYGGSEQTYNAWDGITKVQMEKNRRYNPCGEITDKDGNVTGFYDNQKDNYLQINNQFLVNHKFNARWDMSVTAHYTYGNGYYEQYKNNRSLYTYMLDNLINKDDNPLSKSNLVRKKGMYNHFGGFVSSANYQISKLKLSFGLAWNTYAGDHYGDVLNVVDAVNFNAPFEYYRNSSIKHDGNVFVKANWEIFKGFHLYADVQYRFVNQRIWGKDDLYDYNTSDMQEININKIFNFINPKLGINYNFLKYNSVYASFAMANREPTRKDFVNAEKGKDPLSEQLYDIEFGYRLNHKYVELGLNFYYMIYKDQLVLTGEQNPDTYEALYMNVPNSYRRGIELSIMGHPLKWFSLGGNLTLSQNRVLDYTEYVSNSDTWEMDAIYIGTSTLSYSPSVIASTDFNFHTHGFEVDIFTQYVGKQYITNGQNENLTIDDYCVTNLNLAYTLKTKKIESVRFGIALNNIFNSKYCANAFAYSEISGGERYDEGYYLPQAQFNFLANVTIKF